MFRTQKVIFNQNLESSDEFIQVYENMKKKSKRGKLKVVLPKVSHELTEVNLLQNAALTFRFTAEMCQRDGEKNGIKVVIRETNEIIA